MRGRLRGLAPGEREWLCHEMALGQLLDHMEAESELGIETDDGELQGDDDTPVPSPETRSARAPWATPQAYGFLCWRENHEYFPVFKQGPGSGRQLTPGAPFPTRLSI